MNSRIGNYLDDMPTHGEAIIDFNNLLIKCKLKREITEEDIAACERHMRELEKCRTRVRFE